MKPYRFLEEADQEFHDHIGYFLGYSEAAADRFVSDVARAVRDVRAHPQIGAPISRIVRQRVLTNFKYSILYIDAATEILIVAIAPHRRRPGYWRRRVRNLHR
ncbi:MAG TPA: type II toxin-antitoxin system RelE/ParE family toxin [Thermoanaerobaculia bacterium]|nr:type II toxin-antitoxin system RelE/ParE family toxin [Thermoanaerobaculia bacterium]